MHIRQRFRITVRIIAEIMRPSFAAGPGRALLSITAIGLNMAALSIAEVQAIGGGRRIDPPVRLAQHLEIQPIPATQFGPGSGLDAESLTGVGRDTAVDRARLGVADDAWQMSDSLYPVNVEAIHRTPPPHLVLNRPERHALRNSGSLANSEHFDGHFDFNGQPLLSPSDPPPAPLIDGHRAIYHRLLPPVPTLPQARTSSVRKMPYSYGHFGAGTKRHWTHSNGYRDRTTEWRYR